MLGCQYRQPTQVVWIILFPTLSVGRHYIEALMFIGANTLFRDLAISSKSLSE